MPIRAFLILLAFIIADLRAAELPPLAVQDVFGLQYVSNPVVDPQGRFVVYQQNFMDIMQDRRRSNLWMYDIETKEHLPLVTGPINVGGAVLSNDGKHLAYVAADDSGAQIFVQHLPSSRTAQLTRLPQSPRNLTFDPSGVDLAFTMKVAKKAPSMGKMPKAPKGATWAKAPTVIDSTVYRNDGAGFRTAGFDHVFVVPTQGGTPRQITAGDFNHSGSIAWAPDRTALYIEANRNADWELNVANTEIYRVDLASGEASAITNRIGPDGDVAMSPTGDRLLYVGWDDERLGYHRQRLYVANLDGSDRRELVPNLDRDVNNPQWAADGQSIFFQFDDRGSTIVAQADLKGNMIRLGIELGGTSLGRPYASGSFSVGGSNNLVAYTASSPSRRPHPAELSITEAGSDTAFVVTGLSSGLLNQRALSPIEELWVKSSAGGLDIQAWIAKPPGFDPKKKYPLILEIHGGPFANYGPRFSAEVQLFAAAGYVVVYANPRGSTSYGAEFANEIHHAYPGEDYDDLMAVVDGVIDQGYVDEDQLYVTGGSGGGTLTAWIVGTTDRFRAAVVAKPVINWSSFNLTADMAPYFTRYWFDTLPWESPEDHWRRSPLSRVGNVSTPTMLLTGEDDLRTPMAETEQYYQALKLRGIDTAMVRIPGASHSIARRPSQLMAKVVAILAWFDRYAPED